MTRNRLSYALALSLSSLLFASQVALAQQHAVSSDADAADPAISDVELDDAAEATQGTTARLAKTSLATPFRQFVHVATEVNVLGNVTEIDHPALNGHPEAIVYVTASSTPDGRSGVYNEHQIGVWYNGAQWTVFTQDLAPMPVGAAFNIRVGGGFRHLVTPANTTGFFTTIDNPLINGDPNAMLLVTPVFDDVVAPVYVNHPIFVVFDQTWSINLGDLGLMPAGAAFNVLVAKGFVHEARVDNTTGNLTFIDSPLTNGRPDAKILVTYNGSRSAPDSIVSEHPIGVFYNGARWAIANQDQADIPEGVAFNVFVAANPPRITGARFVGKKLVVECVDFGEEPSLFVNGILPPLTIYDVGSGLLVARKLAKLIPVGATATIEVETFEGLRSDPFVFTRQ